MARRINLYVHDTFYNLLLEKVGRGHISHFIEEKLMPIISNKDKELEDGYRQMAKDKKQMQEAINMANACIGDVGNEPW